MREQSVRKGNNKNQMPGLTDPALPLGELFPRLSGPGRRNEASLPEKPEVMSIFIILSIFRAETGVEYPGAISESQLITLFYKMIIVGFLGCVCVCVCVCVFTSFLMRPTAGQASLTFKRW